jgi:hypothetical protein
VRTGTRIAVLLACVVAPLAHAAPARVIVPAVASLHGANGSYFRSELHLFNASSSPMNVTMTFRCWSGRPCAAMPVTLTIAPRTNVVYADVIADLAQVAESAGALELDYDNANGTLAVTSRLFNQLVNGTAGQSVPGLSASDALTSSVFNFVPTSTDLHHGFRSNAGAFNPGDIDVTTTWTLHARDGRKLGHTVRTFAPHESFQFGTSIDAALAAPIVDSNDAYLSVTSSGPLLPYVSVIDNLSGDPTFLLPQRDDGPASSQTLTIQCERYRFTPGSASPILLSAGTRYRLVFHATDTSHALSSIPQLGIDGGSITPDGDYIVEVVVPESLRGATFNFACTRVCGSGHGSMHGSIEVR